VIISHTHTHTHIQQALILTILGIKTEGRTPDGTAKVVSLFLAECHAVRTGEVEVQGLAEKLDDL
jgi:DTW domain-containing protein YfiP